MNESSQTRILAAILAADVAGYSRLMQDDDRATVAMLDECRSIFHKHIAAHRGRVVDMAGDSVLAVFETATGAVQSALDIQKALIEHNASIPASRRMRFRIGVNLGEVISKGDGSIYGDGVNIAARLQAIGEPDGVCISGNVHEQVKNRVKIGFAFAGVQQVKNIAEPVNAYRLLLESEENLPISPSSVRTAFRVRMMAIGAIAIVAVGAAGAWWYWKGSEASLKTLSTASTSLSLPDKPSIAVLPFVNMSGDKEQEYFSDGITEELITRLAKRAGLFVISRNSVFTYKGHVVKPEQVSRELRVRFVLEGSVQKANTQVRITAQLIDGTNGFHLWAEHYDGDLKDVFALQDSVTQKIVTALLPKLPTTSSSFTTRPDTNSVEAHDLLLRGLAVKFKPQKDTNPAARRLFEAAIELDPNYAQAYCWLGWTYLDEWLFLWSQDPSVLGRAMEVAKKAVALDDTLAEAHRTLGYALLLDRQHDLGLAELRKAISLDPNSSNAFGTLAQGLNWSGKADEAIGFVKEAMRVDPKYPPWVPYWLGDSYYWLRRYDEAIAAYQEAISKQPTYLSPHRMLAAIYSELGRDREAQAEAAEVMRINPTWSLELYRARLPLKHQADLDRITAALRKAGLK